MNFFTLLFFLLLSPAVMAQDLAANVGTDTTTVVYLPTISTKESVIGNAEATEANYVYSNRGKTVRAKVYYDRAADQAFYLTQEGQIWRRVPISKKELVLLD